MKNAIHLLSGKLDPQWQPIFEALRTENERVTRIVRQMLAFIATRPHSAASI